MAHLLVVQVQTYKEISSVLGKSECDSFERTSLGICYVP